MIKAFRSLLPVFIVAVLLLGCNSNNDQEYNTFYDKLQQEESYIGFFKAENKCIAEISEDYLFERRKFFMGVNKSDEEAWDYLESFLEFTLEKELLKEECKEEWEKVLEILTIEMYANRPIFEFKTDKVIEHRDIEYAEYPNKKLDLDLFIPKDPMNKPIPVVVCIHGGGFVVNKKIWFEPFARYLAANGIAAATINYRKMPAVELYDIVHDAKAAVRWTRANAEKYGLDPDRIGAIGASAGALLVTLLGTTANHPELEGDGGNPGISSEVQAVVGIATPAFSPSTKNEWLNEGISEEDFIKLSPYENVSETSAALFLIHGTEDETVLPVNSQELYDKYREAGVHVKLEWIPDEDHGFYEGTDMAIEMAAEFFQMQFSK